MMYFEMSNKSEKNNKNNFVIKNKYQEFQPLIL